MARYIGLSSGTSMDGIDAALVDISGTEITLIAYQEFAYSEPLKATLEAVVTGSRAVTPADFGVLNVRIGLEFAAAACQVLADAGLTSSDIRAIGSHGQTISHGPDSSVPYTLQLGDPNTIAVRAKIATVADFRGKDVALGGQGAPLVPPFHRAMFDTTGRSRAVVNIGGIANVTLLPGNAAEEILAFDTGPGNTLLDQWSKHVRGISFDSGGSWAASGSLDEPLLEKFLSDPYFARRPPKSTGREDFHLEWIQRMLSAAGGVPRAPADVQRTLLELTCATIVSAVKRHLPGCEALILCGGGSRNETLVTRLRSLAGWVRVERSDEHRVPAAAIEAMAFAWLAHRRLDHEPGNVPSVTGAARPAVLGAVYSAE